MPSAKAETKVVWYLDPKKLTKAMKRNIQDILEIGAYRIERVAKALVPVDMGNLKASIHTKTLAWNQVLVGAWGTKHSSYAAAVEFGSVPHTPPFEPIQRWAERHKIPKAAWAIWRKIRDHGIAPKPYLRPAIIMVKKRITKLLKRALCETLRTL